MTASRDPSIDLMIIGVEKAGTTALFRHLGQSPHISTHIQREMFYFLSDDEFARGWEYACDKYFPEASAGIRLAKNVMQVNSRLAMQRLREQCPQVRCVLMFREPASRAWSAYNYAVLRGVETAGSFGEALALEPVRREESERAASPLYYVANSTYAEKLIAAREIFGAENVLVLYHEDYRNSARSELAKIETWLGKDLFMGVKLDLGRHNKAAQPRSRFVARLLHKGLSSSGRAKMLLRRLVPHTLAARLRHALLNLNRVESPNRPMPEDDAMSIRARLAEDREELVRLVGHCPW